MHLGLIKEQHVHFSRLFTGKQGTRLTTLFSGGPLKDATGSTER